MSIIVERFNKIKSNLGNKKANIIAVSKTFSLEHIKPLIDIGHIHFGENKVQEADSKWTNFRSKKNNIKLHMIGKLQSNKAKKAVEIFDYIHSLDNEKLAIILQKLEDNMNKKIKYFIQVNVGGEKQKSGIMPDQLDSFYNFCAKELKLNIIGLMVIPPNNENPVKYFKYLHETNLGLGLSELSMGMSADYIKALQHQATFIRIGSSIFGNRS
ncbi:MAG: YggS family pyridoxal phosphate-dependent enzyme [Pelagibacteraceae bacterium]